MASAVWVCDDSSELADRAAQYIATSARDAVDERGTFALCLSGGDTPGETYRRLASEYTDSIPWDRVHVFWGDERCVPLERPDNHFTMASEAMLAHVPIPPENVHRARGESANPASAASEYEAHLRDFFAAGSDGVPVFDLILLGMGEDGHVASLFPGSDGYAERDRWVVAHSVTKRGERVRRLTLTLPVITAARRIVVLVSGALKAGMLAEVLTRHSALPARRVHEAARDVLWVVDRDAAAAAPGLQDSAECAR